MAQQKPCNIIVNGKLYECSTWKNYHPGGAAVMDKYHNKDATDVFTAFHGEEGFTKLDKMKSIDVPSKVDSVIQDFRRFRQKLEDDGWFNSSKMWYTYKTTETIGVLLLGFLLAYYGHWLIGAIIVGLGYQQLGWLAHDYCHQQVFKNRRLNNAFGYLCGNLLTGLSVNWWKDRHNGHHASTNVSDLDPDLDNLPLFAWDKHDFLSIPGRWGATTLIPYQQYYFLPWTFTLKIIWCLQSIFWNKQAQTPALDKVSRAENATLFVHYMVLFLFCHFTFQSVAISVVFIFLSEFIGGAGIANIVFMNHYVCKQFPEKEQENMNFVELQVRTTRNINPSLWMNWFSGGLNLQIEHHLFPTMPRHSLLKVRPLVQQFCKEHNLPYVSLTWTECMSDVLKKLYYISSQFKEHKKSYAVGGDTTPPSPSIKMSKSPLHTAW
eukprot:TRINITY_DN3658_c0_g1_i1.p1 TRINITY_DN3658_c0_g1~~TRINITY_DN3658_c0_g1_i1.p1  ORF type:complete len:435 (+),score=51.30 TRINITY_DN3658_c0_g1_i1:213-1517(+)